MHFNEIQKKFAQAIRKPETSKQLFPQIEQRRLKVYQELFFNNVAGFVSSGFPVLKSLYQDEVWDVLVRKFFTEHQCHTPYFLEIAEEFLTYLSTAYELNEHDPVFMLELAHYEWMELVLSIRQEDRTEKTIVQEQLHEENLYVSSKAAVVSYAYPVHQISTSFQPDVVDGERHYFVVFRNTNDDVQFVEINALTAMLLEAIRMQEGIKFESLLGILCQNLPQLTQEQLSIGAQQILGNFIQLGIVVSKNAQ